MKSHYTKLEENVDTDTVKNIENNSEKNESIIIEGSQKKKNSFLSTLISKIKFYVKKIKDSKSISFFDLPDCLRFKIMMIGIVGFAVAILMTIAAILFKSLDFVSCGILVFVILEIMALYFYYIFTREKFIPLIVVPLEKRTKKAWRKKNNTYIVIGCCPDGTQRELNVSKQDYSKCVIGATYVFYFAIDSRNKIKPNYSQIYAIDEYERKSNNTSDNTTA